MLYYIELAALIGVVIGLSISNAVVWITIYRDYYYPTTKRARLAARLARIHGGNNHEH